MPTSVCCSVRVVTPYVHKSTFVQLTTRGLRLIFFSFFTFFFDFFFSDKLNSHRIILYHNFLCFLYRLVFIPSYYWPTTVSINFKIVFLTVSGSISLSCSSVIVGRHSLVEFLLCVAALLGTLMMLSLHSKNILKLLGVGSDVFVFSSRFSWSFWNVFSELPGSPSLHMFIRASLSLASDWFRIVLTITSNALSVSAALA